MYSPESADSPSGDVLKLSLAGRTGIGCHQERYTLVGVPFLEQEIAPNFLVFLTGTIPDNSAGTEGSCPLGHN